MGEVRNVRLFRNGHSQAVRIPRDSELPGTDAIMRQENGKLVIEPQRKKSLKRLLAEMRTWEQRQIAITPRFAPTSNAKAPR